MKSILVLAAHPDDEVLGCGGTLAKLADEGASIHVAFLADGLFSRQSDENECQKNLLARRAAARKACDMLGVASISFDEFPDNQMDTIPLLDIAKVIEILIEKYKPDTVFTHHAGDVNIDHRRVHEATTVACRPQKNHSVKTVLFFEIPSSTEWQFNGCAPTFLPNWFSDISSILDRKLMALNCYAAEMRSWPHPRSNEGVTHLVHWRGATIGVDAAEAFMLGRNIS